MKKEVLEKEARVLINKYYSRRNSDTFFAIVHCYELHRSLGVDPTTKYMVEMSNIILLG